MHSPEEIAQAGCTSVRGIRLWEDKGLLGNVARSAGDTRQFTDEQLDRARVIAAAQFGGWTLDEIGEMLPAYNSSDQVYEAITIRLSDQIRAAARLAENLPVPLISKTPLQEYDL